MTGNIVDYNLFFASGGGTDGSWIWKGKTYTQFGDYQQASGNDANSLTGLDPRFVNTTTPDLHLQPTSPAIDKGQELPETGRVDIDGLPRVKGEAIDIGAAEIR
jgi:hypothetical protein